MSLFCVDEAHTIHQCSRSFRPEFIGAMSKITAIRKSLANPVPVILMSATLHRPDRKACEDCLEVKSPAIITGSLARRNVMFLCEISEDEMATIKSNHADNLQQDQETQILLYQRAQPQSIVITSMPPAAASFHATPTLQPAPLAPLQIHTSTPNTPNTYPAASSSDDARLL